MAVNTNPDDPNAIFYREPDRPKYQVLFPWGAGGNLIRHIIGLHPGEELLDQHGRRLNTVEEKFDNLMTYQYPIERQAEHWLGQEWETRYLYNESRVEHHPPASRRGLPTVIIDPDLPRISVRLYWAKNPAMNGWSIKFGVEQNKYFSEFHIPNQLPHHHQSVVVKFSDMMKPMTREWYTPICSLLNLQTNDSLFDLSAQVHARWLAIQRRIWSEKFTMSLDQWIAREQKYREMLDSKQLTQ